MPGFRRMNPAPKIALTRFGAGVHSFCKAEKDLPVGIVPSVIKSWKQAVLRVISFSVGYLCDIRRFLKGVIRHKLRVVKVVTTFGPEHPFERFLESFSDHARL